MKRLGLLAAVCLSTLLGTTDEDALAKTKLHRDEIRGFTCRVEDSFEQVPPRPGSVDLHVAAEWKDGAPRYRLFSSDQPTFRIIWTVEPKNDTRSDVELPPWAEDLAPEQREQLRTLLAQRSEKTLATEVDRLMRLHEPRFGEFVPYAERVAANADPKLIQTATGHDARVVEVNYHEARPKGTEATWWLWVAETAWETERERIKVGFFGYVDVRFADEFRARFEATVASFTPTNSEDDGDGPPATVDDPDNAVERRIGEFIREKVIQGWSSLRTSHYLLVYDDDVDKEKTVDRVAEEIEALRAQLLVPTFGEGRDDRSIAIVRICESRTQYMAYGAPGGTAGYWSPRHEEAVLYEDRNDKKDALRVARGLAAEQYLHAVLDGVAPHAWFTEGHSDYFGGHFLRGGRIERGTHPWRRDTAADAKAHWKVGLKRRSASGAVVAESTPLRLGDWLAWSGDQHYGDNDRSLPGGVSVSLGWSFVYFLRTTENAAYARILPRYFETLVSLIEADRAAKERALERALDGDTSPAPDDATTRTGGRAEWRAQALAEALRGIDTDRLEADWLAHAP